MYRGVTPVMRLPVGVGVCTSLSVGIVFNAEEKGPGAGLCIRLLLAPNIFVPERTLRLCSFTFSAGTVHNTLVLALKEYIA